MGCQHELAEESWLADEFSRQKSCFLDRTIIRTNRLQGSKEMKNLNLAVVLMLIVSMQILFKQTEQFQAEQVAGPTRKQKQPQFAELEADNLQRVAVGRPVKFKCVVNNIGDHKVCFARNTLPSAAPSSTSGQTNPQPPKLAQNLPINNLVSSPGFIRTSDCC